MDSTQLVIIMCFGAIISAIIAKAKNRDVGLWLLLGALMPLLSLIVLTVCSAKPADK